MTYCQLLCAAAAKTVRVFLEWVAFWNGWWLAPWPDTKYIIHWRDRRDSKPHFESKFGGVNAAKLAKKLVWKMSNEFSTRSNKNIKLISCPIIDQTFICQNFIWNSWLNSVPRITRPKKWGPVGKNSLDASPVMAGTERAPPNRPGEENSSGSAEDVFPQWMQYFASKFYNISSLSISF